ncbi:hypothetical protein ACFWVP_09185 [Streptomyces sp. NPDC058637]|uniref:hypothetical protein n=1 Tax=Streptomyces sp. NPDC058637 TaxID=3346569 RepID=UPI00364F8D4C
MAKNTPPADISANYAQRISDDLSANRGEQERVRAELDRLQDELISLETGEQVLVKMREVLDSSASAAPTSSKTAVSVPSARRRKAKPSLRKAAGGTVAPSPNSPDTNDTNDTRKEPGRPTWRELVTEYLSGQREPKSSTEVTAALTEAYPQRQVQVTVVRNTLEQGVAHGLMERHRQGRSVFYSSVSAASVGSSQEAEAPAP